MPATLHERADACIDAILARLGKHIVLGTPLGIGKANRLLDALYARAKADPGLHIDIITALSLNPPSGGSELERRFLKPVVARVWGDYPRMQWLDDFEAGRLPANVRVIEFYVKSGSRLGHPRAQQDYISANYTHVARDMLARGVNLLIQSVSARTEGGQTRYSLAANPDVSLEILPRMQQLERPWMAVAEVNRGLPWMGNDAEVGAEAFHAVFDDGSAYRPFAVPHEPVDDAAWAIGLRAAALVRDGGTLQVGIGSLGDAACHALRLRQRDNSAYNAALEAIGGDEAFAIGARGRFEEGLYVASELISNPLFSLFEDGIVRRQVYDDVDIQRWSNAGLLDDAQELPLFERLHADGGLVRISRGLLASLKRYGLVHEDLQRDGQRLCLPGGARIDNDLDQPAVRAALDDEAGGPGLRGGIAMHGAFFIGPGDFYQRLHDLDETQRARIGMTSVAEVNRIYTGYALERLQRRHPRFINLTMKMTVLGAAVSDQLGEGRVVSGVGGQFDFVSMAHQLPEGRSVLCLRASRGGGETPESNIVWEYPHATVPRHMRDVVVTEYGVADLRGRTDRECIEAMIGIADARCQPALAKAAMAAGKLPADYRIPASAAGNRPERLREALAPYRRDGRLPDLPFGCDLTTEELALAGRLKRLQQATASWSGRRRLLAAALRPGTDSETISRALAHLELERPGTLKARLLARLVRAAYAL